MPKKMRARHEVFGVKDVLDNDFYRDNGWTPVDPSTPTSLEESVLAENAARRGELNEAPAAEVVAAMESLSEDAKADVIAAEKSGKGRKTVLNAD